MRQFLTVMGALMVIGLFFIGCSDIGQPVAPNDGQSPKTSALSVGEGIPADATIDSAGVFVYASAVNARAVGIHRITSSWEESTVNAKTFGNSYVVDPISSVIFEEVGWYGYDVTTVVRGWFDSTFENFGFVFNQAEIDTSLIYLDSREAEANHPFLEVCYTTHEGSACDTLDVIGDAHIYLAEPLVNYGTETSLIVANTGEDSAYKSLVQFEFPVEIRYVTIGDRVWLDLDADGIQDEGEPGVTGLKVVLEDCDGNQISTTSPDENGYYQFESIMAGEYRLAIDNPPSYARSPRDVGSDDAIDSDADPETGYTDCFTMLPGTSDMSLDFGLYPMGSSIGDLVWHDADMNGLQDDGEEGFADIMVKLFTCEGDMVASTMTDENGAYMFEMIQAGDYYFEFVNPFGYIFTYQDVGDDDDLDSDVDRYQKRTACFTLEPGVDDFSWDAGLFAYDGCTYSKGYWKNHGGFGPQDDEVTKLLPVWLGNDDGDKSLAVTDVQMAVDLLSQHVYGHPRNGITKLYAQLLAAKLNIVNFANPEEVDEAIEEADDFLADYDWNDWESLDKEHQQMILEWKDMFDRYNNGLIGPGHCDDNNDDDDDGNMAKQSRVGFDKTSQF